MCWSWQVSLLFALIESAGIAVIIWTVIKMRKIQGSLPVIRREFLDRALHIVPFLLTVNIVEWSEVFIWLSHPPLFTEYIQAEEAVCEQCTMGNTFFTMMCAGAVTLQPVTVMWFAFRTHRYTTFCLSGHGRSRERPDVLENDGAVEEFAALEDSCEESTGEHSMWSDNEQEHCEQSRRAREEGDHASDANIRSMKIAVERQELNPHMLRGETAEQREQHGEIFRLLFYLSTLTTGIMYVSYWLAVYLDRSGQGTPCFHDPSILGNMLGKCTCSYEGVRGHLMWMTQYPCSWIQLLPNIYVYFLMFNVALMFYGPVWFVSPMIAAFFIFLPQFWWYGGTVEAMSIWCWEGSLAVVGCMVATLAQLDSRMMLHLEAAGLNGTLVQLGAGLRKAMFLHNRKRRSVQY